MTAQVKARDMHVREIEIIDASKPANDTPPQLTLGDLRKLIARADKDKLDDHATLYAGLVRESSSQPGRWFVGHLLVQQVDA